MKLKRILCMLVAAMTLSAATVYTAFAEENEADSKPEPAAMEETVGTGKDAETGKDGETAKETETDKGVDSADDGETNETDADADSKDAEKDAKDAENVVASLGLENPCEVDENGDVMLEDGKLIDLILPKAMNGEALTSIAAKSFAGCPFIRSVVVPETILEIGEGAFADCEFLETIYVIGHSEEDMTLGDNWNGGAEVVYVAEEGQEDEAPVEDEADADAEDKDAGAAEQEDADKKDAPADEQPDGKEDVTETGKADKSDKTDDTSDPSSAGSEEKTPAEKGSSDEEKKQETPDAALPDDKDADNKDAAPSDDASKSDPQGGSDVSSGGGEDAPVPAGSPETAGN